MPVNFVFDYICRIQAFNSLRNLGDDIATFCVKFIRLRCRSLRNWPRLRSKQERDGEIKFGARAMCVDGWIFFILKICGSFGVFWCLYE